jgi:hypothetical protein
MDIFPSEIKEKIFSYLNHTDLLAVYRKRTADGIVTKRLVKFFHSRNLKVAFKSEFIPYGKLHPNDHTIVEIAIAYENPWSLEQLRKLSDELWKWFEETFPPSRLILYDIGFDQYTSVMGDPFYADSIIDEFDYGLFDEKWKISKSKIILNMLDVTLNFSN